MKVLLYRSNAYVNVLRINVLIAIFEMNKLAVCYATYMNVLVVCYA